MADPTILTTQRGASAGIAPTFTAVDATNGNKILNTGRTLFTIKNSAAQGTVTVVTPNTADGNAISDKAVVIPATTGNVEIGALPVAVYNDVNGYVTFLFSGGTLTINAYEP